MTNYNTSRRDQMFAVDEQTRRRWEAEQRAAEEQRKREKEEQRRREEEWRNSPQWKQAEDLKAQELPVAYYDADGKRSHADELPIGGKVRIKLDDLAVLGIYRDKVSYATLTKLGVGDLPATARIEEGRIEYLIFDAGGADVEQRRLGPGVVVYSYGTIAAPDGQNRRWAKRPDEVGIAPIPAALTTVDPIPLDETEYDRGIARRVTVNPGTSGPPEKLHPTLLKGRVNVFQSEPGIGKSMSALAIEAHLMQARKNVIYFDADGNGARIGERFASLGVDRDVLNKYFYYYNEVPDPEHLSYLLDAIKPVLVVFDNLTNLFARAGVNENDNVAVAGWFNQYPARVRERGTTVLILDHVAKARNGRYARGAGSKLAEEDVSWLLTQPQEFNRDKVGAIKFALKKDNDGAMTAKTLTFRAGGSPFVFEMAESVKLTDQQRAILDCLIDGATSAEWLRVAKAEARIAHNSTFTRTVRKLVSTGFVEEDEDDGTYRVSA